MTTIKSFYDLTVWQRSRVLAGKIYDTTATFPQREIYGLVSQMRRAVVSIPSNIAEGCVRGTRRDFANFISIALGSCAELTTQIVIASDLHFISDETREILLADTTEISKMLTALRKKLLTVPVKTNN